MFYGKYPASRLRRLRQSSWMRDLVSETSLTPKDLIWPIFVRDEFSPADIQGMPNVKRLTISELQEAVQYAADLGISSVALFPYTPLPLRSHDGLEAVNPDNLMCRAIHAIKNLNLDIGVITDVALDPYTDHAHDGIIINGRVHNDATIEILKRQAHIQAQAGADVLAPSDMMDGRIGAIRGHLDENHFHDKIIMSYAVKFASSFYGPFRSAVGAESLHGLSDKKTYQVNFSNSDEAMREIAQDIEEGADMIIIKPGLPYSDVIHRAKQKFNIPIIAYQVSGEYSMIKAAAANGWIDGTKAMLESLMCLKRAGASGIFTYAAPEMAELLSAVMV
ncbi:porphobilinogen synthase [Candidatus Paracaedibacter symbiosus]|uniref:porphobilinogen synthase n=1 Tax=Candidatus Paracaedibacter symbiosus TaxID=244582 RepID=UPI0005098A05|nr:porphobilinogen synthase [Candidatus Paracaedibacter symbiosus]